jgi:lipopolysaccharide heptosyltransferase II
MSGVTVVAWPRGSTKAASEPVPGADDQRHAAWRGVRRLIAVRVDNLGDVLMTTPALAAAAASSPGLEITLLGGPGAQSLAPHLPMVHDVVCARVPWVRHEDGGAADDELALVERLAVRRFDAAIVFTASTQSALPAAMLCKLAGIPLRLAHVRENPYELLTDWAPEIDTDIATARHEVRRQLELVAQVGWHAADEGLRFSLRPADVDRVDRRLASFAGQGSFASPGPLVVVHVGATAPSRRWPAERFGMAAEAIARRSGARLVFTGTVSEAALVEAARGAMSLAMRARSESLAGALTIGELGALIARADLLLTNNSGPAHLAAALGTPVVDLYALTNPQHTPWQVPSRVLSHDVPCRNCLRSRCPQGHHLCLRGVASHAAADAAIELLAEHAGVSDRRPAAVAVTVPIPVPVPDPVPARLEASR